MAAIAATAGLLLLVILSACATRGVNQGDINVVSLEEEWELGRQLEKDLAKNLTLVTDATVVNYVNKVGRRIVKQTELAHMPWKFHVVRDKDINAFNIPGGHVYVNTGLIATADNASELAGVIGHEVAHGVARHGTEQLTRVYGLNLLAGGRGIEGTLPVAEAPVTVGVLQPHQPGLVVGHRPVAVVGGWE